MKIDPTKINVMPQIMGPVHEKDPLPKIPYPQSETIAMQFHTEYEAARELVPDCFEVDQKPIVTVVFVYHNGLDFPAGGGYSLATVWVSARFDGQRDHIDGDYILVMFENQTRPIIGGREFLGVLWGYTDIPPAKIMPNRAFRCEVSLWGHLLFGIELPPLRKQNPIVKTVASKRINSRPWLAYKYIPSLDEPPDADYPTTTRNDIKIDNFWIDKSGSLYFGTATAVDIGDTVTVINALKSLPIGKFLQVLHFDGSAVLRYDQSYRLR